MEALINTISNQLIWSLHLVVLCFAAGIFYSLKTRFSQVRLFKHMIKLMFNKNTSSEGISSWQALTVALSGRVGTGNIAGVATAIVIGGPGAIFWMWMVAFLGASSAYVEATLGQIYKEVDDNGKYRGGPAYYFSKCFGSWFGIIFAVATIISCGMFLPGVQANTIASAVDEAAKAIGLGGGATYSLLGSDVSQAKLFVMISLVILLSLIIFGGIKRIAHFTQVVVPFMAILFMGMAVIVCIFHITELPAVFFQIIKEAFIPQAAFGAMIGIGVKRGIYSNEAGQGTAAHAAAAAEVEHPAQQGLVQSFSVYIDTILVCSATAFMILLTNSYNIAGLPEVNAPAGSFMGPENTQLALSSLFGSTFGTIFVAISIFLFAFTTILAYYYMAETNFVFLKRYFKNNKFALFITKIVVLSSVSYGVISTAGSAWALGDIGVGLMAWINIIGIILIYAFRQKPAINALKDYEEQLNAGKTSFTFDPKKYGIEGATFWEDKLKKQDTSK